MISHQDARRNLSPGELIYANSMVAEEIALENREKMAEGGRIGADITNGKAASVHLDGGRDTESKSHTLPPTPVSKSPKCQVSEQGPWRDMMRL